LSLTASAINEPPLSVILFDDNNNVCNFELVYYLIILDKYNAELSPKLQFLKSKYSNTYPFAIA
jgi:hypothetical protein